MEFRASTIADLPEIMSVVTRMTDGTAFEPPTEDKLRELVSGGRYYTEGVWRDGRLVAFMCGNLAETYLNHEVNAYDKGLFVLPEERGGRLAVRLVHNFEAWAKKAGASKVWLAQSVGQNQNSTLHFFERLGYECQGFITCKKL